MTIVFVLILWLVVENNPVPVYVATYDNKAVCEQVIVTAKKAGMKSKATCEEQPVLTSPTPK